MKKEIRLDLFLWEFYFMNAQLIFLSILTIKHLKFFCFHV